MDADLDTLATALCARVDDLLKGFPERLPARPVVGIAPRISDAELVTLAVLQALLGHTSEARWLRFASGPDAAPVSLPAAAAGLQQAAPAADRHVELAAQRPGFGHQHVDRGRVGHRLDAGGVRPFPDAVRRSELAGWAEYGYCASHSRYFWGLRLHLVALLAGLPIGYALTGAKADERQVLLDLLTDDPTLVAARPGQILIADKAYFGRDFESTLADARIELLRRARKGEPERPGGRFFKPLRQTVESIFDTLKGQLDLERHGGHTPADVLVRVLQRMLALTSAIWHNDHTGQIVKRSLLAYDH